MSRNALFSPGARIGRHTTLGSCSSIVALRLARHTALLPAALLLAAALATALLAAAPAHSSPRATSGQAARYTLGPGKVAVYDLAGGVVLEPTTGPETIIEVTFAGRDADRLKVATGEAEGRRNVRVLYPDEHIIYPPFGPGSNTSTSVRPDGTFGGRNSSLWPTGRRVKISGWGSGLEAHADLKLLVPKGADVLLRLMVGDVRVTNVDSKLNLDIGSGSVVTTGTRGGLAIDTGSGSVRVARADGLVSIDTGSGGVSVHDLRGGDLVIDTGSGDVDVSAIEASTLSVDTGSGRVDLDEVSSRSVHVDTGSGGVTIGLKSIVDELNIDTGSGGVEVSLPRETGAMLSLETGSGGLDVDVPLTTLHRDHGELHGRMGDGRGRIVIETGSGGIHIGGR